LDTYPIYSKSYADSNAESDIDGPQSNCVQVVKSTRQINRLNCPIILTKYRELKVQKCAYGNPWSCVVIVIAAPAPAPALVTVTAHTQVQSPQSAPSMDRLPLPSYVLRPPSQPRFFCTRWRLQLGKQRQSRDSGGRVGRAQTE
jgi:hypothetical protein